MTARELLNFLQTLDDKDLNMDVEMQLETNHAGSINCFVEGIGIDCNGFYMMDEYYTKLFGIEMENGDILFK